MSSFEEARKPALQDGLDDNFMPAPPGNYGVKGIFSRASVWPIDGEQHTIGRVCRRGAAVCPHSRAGRAGAASRSSEILAAGAWPT